MWYGVVLLICLCQDIDEPVDSPPESSGSSEPAVAEPAEVLRDEPKRKRVKKDPVEMKDEGSEQERSPVDPNLSAEEQQKHQQLAAFLSVLAQQTPLNASTKQKSSSAGPSKQVFIFHILFYLHVWTKKVLRYVRDWFGTRLTSSTWRVGTAERLDTLI